MRNLSEQRKTKSSGASRPRVLLIVETSMAYGRRVLEGIAAYLVKHPPWSVQLDLRELVVPEPSWLEQWDGDGIICRATTPELAATLLDNRIPTVDLTDIYGDQGLPCIWNDHHAIGRLAADHLMERGFRNFAFCGFSGHVWSATRRDGFCGQIGGARRVDVHESSWFDARGQGWEDQQERIAQWLRSLPKPVGVMGCNDVRGQHVLDACRRLDLAVPEKVTVIGVDNDKVVCDLCDPPLSSVIPNGERVGYLAAEMLAQLMRGETPERTKVLIEPTGIVTRQSTDVLAIDDAMIADALRFIRENACGGITVDDLLAAVPVSRSILERRFRKYLDRSPQAEIRHVQLKRVCQLLAESDLSIDQIARLAGFKHPEYLSVVFKREMLQTPGQYRASSRVD